ncbi:MAG: hypothetical protein GY727_00670, partial [Gammaproteobacteria bacterium]|nr:hypothetical protein [Gammaproteobacteria bacterium]
MMLLVNAAVEAVGPSVVQSLAVVTGEVVLQHVPCSVGFGTPRFVTVPLPVAVVIAMLLTACVVTVAANDKGVVEKV